MKFCKKELTYKGLAIFWAIAMQGYSQLITKDCLDAGYEFVSGLDCYTYHVNYKGQILPLREIMRREGINSREHAVIGDFVPRNAIRYGERFLRNYISADNVELAANSPALKALERELQEAFIERTSKGQNENYAKPRMHYYTILLSKAKKIHILKNGFMFPEFNDGHRKLIENLPSIQFFVLIHLESLLWWIWKNDGTYTNEFDGLKHDFKSKTECYEFMFGNENEVVGVKRVDCISMRKDLTFDDSELSTLKPDCRKFRLDLASALHEKNLDFLIDVETEVLSSDSATDEHNYITTFSEVSFADSWRKYWEPELTVVPLPRGRYFIYNFKWPVDFTNLDPAYEAGFILKPGSYDLITIAHPNLGLNPKPNMASIYKYLKKGGKCRIVLYSGADLRYARQKGLFADFDKYFEPILPDHGSFVQDGSGRPKLPPYFLNEGDYIMFGQKRDIPLSDVHLKSSASIGESADSENRTLWSGTTAQTGQQNMKNLHLVLTPNPTTGVLKIIHPFQDTKIESVEVYDLHAQKVMEGVISKQGNPVAIDLTHRESGLYFLKIICSDGTVHVEKIVKIDNQN